MDLVAGAVGSIIGKLGKLLQEEYKLQAGLPEQIESLKIELESAHAALRTVAEVPPEQLNQQDRLWAREVREASYDMEDILDTFLVNVENKGGLGKPRLLKMRELFRKIKARHHVAGAMEKMEARLRQVAVHRDRYKVPVAAPAPASKPDPRLMYMHREAAQLVDIHTTKAELMAMLLPLPSSRCPEDDVDVSASGGDKMKIVSVVGAGGLGKTTLAKAVYDELKPRYDHGAFVSVGRKPDLVQVFTSIFFLLDERKHEAIREVKNLQLLTDELRRFLQDKRYLIVIDDVWDTKSWQTIKTTFDQKNKQSRVITTTRNRQVASSEDVYELHPLSHDSSKKLFYMRLFGGEDKCPANHPEEESKKILGKCGGVPLAIITMASLLVGKSRDDWLEVCNSPSFYRGKDNNEQVDDTVWILSLSYYDLPSHLKTCLLYLSVYPEDFEIEKHSLIWKWVAEGFIEKKEGSNSLFEQGEEYFHELINRSMIQAVEYDNVGWHGFPGMIYGCRVHDMVLDLICDLSNEENFVTISYDDDGRGTPSSSSSSSRNVVRRLAHKNRRITEDNPVRGSMTQLRSLVACGCDIDGWVLHPSSKLLRVLALEKCTLPSTDIRHLGKLLHLRYLGLRGTGIRKLPDEIGSLKFLQALDLQRTEISLLPQTVGLLTQLMYLHGAALTRVPDGFLGKKTSLEELHICPPTKPDSQKKFMEDLGNQAEIRVLDLEGRGRFDPSVESGLMQSLGGLHKLQTLRVRYHNFVYGFTYKRDKATQGSRDRAYKKDKATQGSWDRAALPRRLRILSLSNLWFPRLPLCIDPACLPNLSHLHLHVNHLDEAGLRALGGLPELTYLQLLTPHGLTSSFSNKATVVDVVAADGFFLKLRSLCMDGWMVQLVPSDDSTSVSFSIWRADEDVVALGSRTKGECSKGVAPTSTPIIMPDLIHLEFSVPVRALYKSRNGSRCDSLGWECLPSLHKIMVGVNCVGAYIGDVEKTETEMRRAAKLHTNQPIIKFYYYNKRSTVTESDDDRNLPAQEKVTSSSFNGLEITEDVQENAGLPL